MYGCGKKAMMALFWYLVAMTEEVTEDFSQEAWKFKMLYL
jgi:hypothetical protein